MAGHVFSRRYQFTTCTDREWRSPSSGLYVRESSVVPCYGMSHQESVEWGFPLLIPDMVAHSTNPRVSSRDGDCQSNLPPPLIVRHQKGLEISSGAGQVIPQHSGTSGYYFSISSICTKSRDGLTREIISTCEEERCSLSPVACSRFFPVRGSLAPLTLPAMTGKVPPDIQGLWEYGSSQHRKNGYFSPCP